MKYRNVVMIFVLAFASLAFASDDNGGSNNGCDDKNKGQDCHSPTPTPTPAPSPAPAGSGQNTNTSASDSHNSNKNSSSSKSTSKGGSVKDSGNSSAGVVGSGNSTSSNKQGQGQEQSNNSSNTNNTQSSASDNGNGNGNGSNDTSITTNVAAPKIPVATAYAPTAIATVSCFKAYSGGGQAPNFGFSIGGGKVDGTCQTLEVARSYAISGSRKAYCKMMVGLKQSKAAGITFDDCMYEDPAPAAAQAASMPPATAQPTKAVVAANPPSAEPVIDPVQAQRKVSPEMGCDKADNTCKARLDDSIMYLQHSPDSYIILTHGGEVANVATATQIQAFLLKGGISRDRIKLVNGMPRLGSVDITFGAF
jgi:hypothetical protein